MVWFMVFNANFNNISVISWRKPEYPEKPTTCRKSLTNLSHNVVSSTPRHKQGSNSQL